MPLDHREPARNPEMKIPAGAGISIPGTNLDLGDQAPRRRANRSVVPVLVIPVLGVAIPPAIAVAVVVVAAGPLPHHDRPDAVPVRHPAVIVAAVPMVESDGTVAAASPVLRRPMAMDSFDQDDPRALDHGDPARGGPPVGGVAVADNDMTGDRPAPYHYARLDPLSVERGGGGHETGDQRPGDGASHKVLELGTG
jgi:hypothetical protein